MVVTECTLVQYSIHRSCSMCRFDDRSIKIDEFAFEIQETGPYKII